MVYGLEYVYALTVNVAAEMSWDRSDENCALLSLWSDIYIPLFSHMPFFSLGVLTVRLHDNPVWT